MNKYRILVKGIVQRDNKYLAVEKWYDDNIMEPYQWEFIDGEAEFGESPDKAVVRTIQDLPIFALQSRMRMKWFCPKN